jgi:SNF2 family DNA or RNA helicase
VCPYDSVVFSSWKKTLTLVAELLEGQGILYSMIEGSLSLSRRLQELEKYENQEERNVLLMTLGTGAVG